MNDDFDTGAIAMAMRARAKKAWGRRLAKVLKAARWLACPSRWRRGLATLAWAAGALGILFGFSVGFLSSLFLTMMLIDWIATPGLALRAEVGWWLAGSAVLSVGLLGWVLSSQGALWRRPHAGAMKGFSQALTAAGAPFELECFGRWVDQAASGWTGLAWGWSKALLRAPWAVVLGLGMWPCWLVWVGLSALGMAASMAGWTAPGQALAPGSLATVWRRWLGEMTREGRSSEEFAKAQRDQLGSLAKAATGTAARTKGRL